LIFTFRLNTNMMIMIITISITEIIALDFTKAVITSCKIG